MWFRGNKCNRNWNITWQPECVNSGTDIQLPEYGSAVYDEVSRL